MANSIFTRLLARPSGADVDLSTVEDVLVMRALPGLGDFLCVTPALRALRAALPHATITLLGLPATRELVERYPDLVDDFLDFPGFPGLPERPVDIPGLLDLLRAFEGHFDLGLQMHGNGTVSNQVVQRLRPRVAAGFYSPSHAACPDPSTFTPYPNELPEPRAWLALLEFLGLPSRGEQLEFPLTAGDEAELDAVLRELGVPGDARLAVVHAGASETPRRLDPHVLAGVADGLAGRGLGVVLTGAHDEAGLARAVRARASCRPIDLTGRTSLGGLGALVRRAEIVVTNDTGISHLASALQTPSVVVFLASDTSRWAPLDRDRHRVIDGKLVAPSIATILREADRVHERAGACLRPPPGLLDVFRF